MCSYLLGHYNSANQLHNYQKYKLIDNLEMLLQLQSLSLFDQSNLKDP